MGQTYPFVAEWAFGLILSSIDRRDKGPTILVWTDAKASRFVRTLARLCDADRFPYLLAGDDLFIYRLSQPSREVKPVLGKGVLLFDK